MAINVNAPTTTQVGANKTAKHTGPDQALEAKSGNGTDTALSDEVVELSDRGRTMEALESSVQNMPDVDQDKVDSIRNAITNGEYEIDYDKLASAFRRFESEL
ncbi:flagellar biosynthesis anti-sigma factor FlgM [Reinekea marinisedimentorum]|uniref:Negative regulator of flagellin synthesis n=1 Tax=Reinekea marinisedimentorum TaxID=230495 RepID=A0A4R3I573_9GAMM|nr:flagellar biosynthesis anti-sigma factor FlgM [Reinekea marinisedimentorum]TCS39925.1 negative regulator of flagellin synthesis FlgM [Reinekea marinisedimentorum]